MNAQFNQATYRLPILFDVAIDPTETLDGEYPLEGEIVALNEIDPLIAGLNEQETLKFDPEPERN